MSIPPPPLPTIGLLSIGFVSLACGSSKESYDEEETGGAGGESAETGGTSGEAPEETGGIGGNNTGGDTATAAAGGETETGESQDGGASSGGQADGENGMGGAIGEAPVIELVGPEEILLDCGDTFEDPGASASDEEDGKIEVTTLEEIPVSTDVPGKFTISYEAEDEDGNITQKDRLVSVCGPSCGEVGWDPIDLSSWTTVQYEFNKQANSRWVVSDDNFGVVQSVNSDASIFLSDFDATDLQIEGKWELGPSTDDDYVGFVFGYQDRGHYYLFDWKRAEQLDDHGFAERGMTLRVVSVPKVDGVVIDASDEDLWQTTASENATVLEHEGQPLNNDIGWEPETSYSFHLEFHAGSFKVEIYDADDSLLQSWSAFDDTYAGGGFGFYNYSQAPVTYRSFSKRVTPPACSTIEE